MIFAMAFAQFKANWLVPVGAVTYALVWELSNKIIKINFSIYISSI